MLADWSAVKSILTYRNLSAQYTILGSNFWIKAIDGAFEVECIIPVDASISEDSLDFITNFQGNANKKEISPIQGIVTTQYELNNKDLKLACMVGQVGDDGTALASLKVPGTFGSGDGRYVAGGYGITEDYNKDDRALCYISDDDRAIAWMLALTQNPSATSPLSDNTIQQLGVLPSPIGIAMPNYPMVKAYYDEQLSVDQQGWFFWATALGNNLNPIGEVELEPIAGYAFIPSGLYLKIKYIRPHGIITGGLRVNLDWGKLGEEGSL